MSEPDDALPEPSHLLTVTQTQLERLSTGLDLLILLFATGTEKLDEDERATIVELSDMVRYKLGLEP